MHRRGILSTALATTVLLLAAVPAADAAKPARSFVDMDDDGTWSKGDVAISLGGLKVLDGGGIVMGKLMGNTYVIVRNGHDVHLGGRLDGTNLAVVNRGGDVYVVPGTRITASGQHLALAARSADGDTPSGELVIGAGASVRHVFAAGKASQVQLEAGHLRFEARSVFDSRPRNGTAPATDSGAASASTARVLVTATESLWIAPDATISAPFSDVIVTAP